jgi:mannose-1-phosphate guanylyltransferase / mannose-6-phosphate isomerase
MPIAALVLSGGGGLRLWPASNDRTPKQFLDFFDGVSLFQRTLTRLRAASVDAVYVIGNAAHQALLAEQAAAVGFNDVRYLFEPARRDSAAAIAAGVAAIAADLGEDTVALALPCDHLIPDEPAFAGYIAQAVAAARLGHIVTIGLKPTAPSTEFGYIQRAGRLPGHPTAYAVKRFHEKPALGVAQQYVRDADFSWNSGMFIFEASVFAAEAAALMPDIWSAASGSVARAARDGAGRILDKASFEASPRTSIDFGLIEKSARIAVVPADLAWSDVGTWAAVHDASPQPADGVATVGDVVTHAVSNALIHATGVKVVAAGVSDIVIVATPEGVLVTRKDLSAMVKPLLEKGR